MKSESEEKSDSEGIRKTDILHTAGALKIEGRKKYETETKFATIAGETEILLKINMANEIKKETKTSEKGFNLAPFVVKTEASLTANIDLGKLKSKYKNREIELKKEDYELFQEENEDNIFSKTAITNAIDQNEYLEEFNKEKMEALEEDLPKQEKKMKGWGDWTGFGVKEKEVDVEKEKRDIQIKIVK